MNWIDFSLYKKLKMSSHNYTLKTSLHSNTLYISQIWMLSGTCVCNFFLHLPMLLVFTVMLVLRSESRPTWLPFAKLGHKLCLYGRVVCVFECLNRNRNLSLRKYICAFLFRFWEKSSVDQVEWCLPSDHQPLNETFI